MDPSPTRNPFDVIDGTGAYAGGVIAPGIDLSIDALHRAASKLPKISVQKPDSVIGKSTVQAMRSGIYHGYESLIEGVVKSIRAELKGGDVLVLATGGLATLSPVGRPASDPPSAPPYPIRACSVRPVGQWPRPPPR